MSIRLINDKYPVRYHRRILQYWKQLAGLAKHRDEERGQDGQSHSGYHGITNGFSIVHCQTWPNQDGTLFTAGPFSLN
jgi:hypothetical protein